MRSLSARRAAAALQQHARRRARTARTRATPLAAVGGWRGEAEAMAAERAAAAGAGPPPAAAAGRSLFASPRRKVLAIVPYPSPVLRAANADVTAFDSALRLLTREMFALMYRTDGVGLAAPQVGVNARLMVFNPAGDPAESGSEVVLCNPTLVGASDDTGPFEEGCLSFPGVYADVVRPLSVTVSYQDVAGARQTLALDGLAARIFQHEFDHLQGTLFHDRMDAAALAAVRPQLDALETAWATREAAGAGGARPARARR